LIEPPAVAEAVAVQRGKSMVAIFQLSSLLLHGGGGSTACCRAFRLSMIGPAFRGAAGFFVGAGGFLANVRVFLPRQARSAAPFVSAIQARTYAADAKASPTEVSSILEQRIRGVQEESNLAETGRVLSVGYVGAGGEDRRATQRWPLVDQTAG
jgi:hypothetical protein